MCLHLPVACLHLPVAIAMPSSNASTAASSSPSSIPADAVGIRHSGVDDRGWFIVDVDAGPNQLHKVTIGPNKKKVLLVGQHGPMRVYVNPDPTKMDEWQVGNVIVPVRSPEE